MIERITRRRLIATLGGGASGLLLAGCDAVGGSSLFEAADDAAQRLTRGAQGLVTGRGALAREYGASDMSPTFRTNGTVMPASPAYRAHLAAGFADWRLVVGGLVERPLALPLDRIRRLPARTQITRHDCVEGWSGIAKWTGVPLRLLLKGAGLKTEARYLIFHCADDFGGTPCYESIDLIDAFHPQTILAWAMNDRLLEVGHGAPLRLRVERQLGYKHAKYVMRIEAAASLAHVGRGKGGFWEDRSGYQWYAGI
ncbi:MAG TPA: molybdopterin-dependent oxidoreductase [Allosphingosinicella sp.]|nr:molybdopterin-dependent oxidoreductase [Allosphingosinicella sp.]